MVLGTKTENFLKKKSPKCCQEDNFICLSNTDIVIIDAWSDIKSFKVSINLMFNIMI